MKKAVIAIQIFLVVLVGVFFIPNLIKESHIRKKAQRHLKELQADAKKKCPVTEEKPFVLLIPSYNNIEYCERNLHSVFSQKYSNYRVIYIDDLSTDGTYEKVKEMIASCGQEHRVQLIHNANRIGGMANYYLGSVSCKDEEIVINLDGDDWLAHDWVLQRLNEAYANPEVWATYGSYCDYPSYQKGGCAQKIPGKVLRHNSIRKHVHNGWILSHLRTFYAGLFKKITVEHMMYKGNFLESTADQAYMLPIAEMCGPHLLFVEDVLYVYNRSNPISDDKVAFQKQQECMYHIWSLPVYDRLEESPIKHIASAK